MYAIRSYYEYTISAPLFCDASGDGIVAFQAGASFRIGAETKDEFGELFAPDESYGELLGHSIFFYSKRASAPVKYTAPNYALKDITAIPRYKVIEKEDSGCRFWWLEYGGRKDTIHETEEIKYELWKVRITSYNVCYTKLLRSKVIDCQLAAITILKDQLKYSEAFDIAWTNAVLVEESGSLV